MYLKYKKVFNHPEMEEAEVSVAYQVNAQVRSIKDMDSSFIWVYFPTREITELPFLIHGSFETAVSREKLMTGSAFNRNLFDQLGDLIADSMIALAKRKLITQSFLRRVIIPSFQDEAKHNTIDGLKKKITKVFQKEPILPDQNGEYRNSYSLQIPIPFAIADLRKNSFWKPYFESEMEFIAFSGERERNFTDYYLWLRHDLHLVVYNMEHFAQTLYEWGSERKICKSEINEYVKLFDFLSDYCESQYPDSPRKHITYETEIERYLKSSWKILRKAPIILNKKNCLLPAYKKGELGLYLHLEGGYLNIDSSSIVHGILLTKYKSLIRDSFCIKPYDNHQHVKEIIFSKYRGGRHGQVSFKDPSHYEKEYIHDFRNILSVIEKSTDSEEIIGLLRSADIIKSNKKGRGEMFFIPPANVYAPVSKEGINLDTYYEKTSFYDEYENFGGLVRLTKADEKPDGSEKYVEAPPRGIYPLDIDFYERNNISINDLEKLGIITSPVTEGIRNNPNGRGDNYWIAQGDYCPQLQVHRYRENLEYIQNHPEERLSKEKSVQLFKLFIKIHKKTFGVIQRGKRKPQFIDEKTQFLNKLITYRWIFAKDGEVLSPKSLSRFEIDPNIYGDLYKCKEACDVLGFIEKEGDAKTDAYDAMASLDKRDKTILFRQLARELGYDLNTILSLDQNTVAEQEDIDYGEEQFDPNTWESEEFPQRKIKNKDLLIEHVRKEFFFADPVKYSKVLRQIRTSKSKTMRAYSISMYQTDSNSQICQMCRKATPYVEITEIANYGIEMPQLNLCLCKNCSSKYKKLRDAGKDKFKENVTKDIEAIDINIPAEDYAIELTQDCSVHFTQTHLGEVKEILSLLAKYGTPGDH